MLKIRQQQLDAMMEVMPDERMPELESLLVEHLRTHFPAQLRGEDEHSLLVRIRRGVTVGREHGLLRRGSWAVLIDLMVVLGPDFLERADCQWARFILAAPAEAEERRIAHLRHAAIEHLRQVAEL